MTTITRVQAHGQEKRRSQAPDDTWKVFEKSKLSVFPPHEISPQICVHSKRLPNVKACQRINMNVPYGVKKPVNHG
jgi:hypothetical protein